MEVFCKLIKFKVWKIANSKYRELYLHLFYNRIRFRLFRYA